MVQITRENKKKVYSYLLEEGVIVVKKVFIKIDNRNLHSLTIQTLKYQIYMFGLC